MDKVHCSWYVLPITFFSLIGMYLISIYVLLPAIPGSFVFTMGLLPLYAIVAPAIGFSTEYYGIVPHMWSDPVFWFSILVFPAFCLIRDYVWK